MQVEQDGAHVSMRVLGMDLSLTASGLCVVEPAEGTTIVRRVASATIKRKLPPGQEALCVMAEAVVMFTKGWDLERVAIEDVFAMPTRVQEGETEARAQVRAAKQRQYGLELARLGGMVEYLLWRRGITVQRWMPASWRSRVLGKNVAKMAVPLKLYQRYAVEFPDEHQAMAFGLATATLLQATGGVRDDRAGTGRAAARRPAAPSLPGIV